MLSIPAMVGLVVAALIGSLAGTALWIADDWGRDFTTNYAATSDDARLPDLRPLEAALSETEMADLIEGVASSLPRWELHGREMAQGRVNLHFVRTTRLMRFRDDVRVEIVATQRGCRVTASSRSRIGKGDLGQNPRNLAELMGAVRRRIASETLE